MEADVTTLINVVVGFVIPLLVGLLSKWNASSRLKAILNIGLTTLASLVASIIPADFTWSTFAVNFVITYSMNIASYYGLWKPTATAEVVNLKTARFGIGKKSEPHTWTYPEEGAA